MIIDKLLPVDGVHTYEFDWNGHHYTFDSWTDVLWYLNELSDDMVFLGEVRTYDEIITFAGGSEFGKVIDDIEGDRTSFYVIGRKKLSTALRGVSVVRTRVIK
jgi:hypothetical protein